MKMKELERETGIGRETIRFYIREGLLPEPVRPKRNVASYGPQHVARLKLIKRLQQERFLPLNVIKTIVKSEAENPATGFEALIGLENRLGPLLSEARDLAPRKIEEVAETSGLGVDEIRRLAEFEFVAIDAREDGEWLNPRNARLVELVGEGRRSGFDDGVGYTVDEYKIYAQLAQVLAHHEVSTFYRNLGRQADPDRAAELAARGIEIGNAFMALLRTEKIVREIERVSVRGGALETEEEA